jgi:hypothetical protein
LDNITDLTKLSETPTNVADLRGAIVYNINPGLMDGTLNPGVGVYYWNGAKWIKEVGGSTSGGDGECLWTGTIGGNIYPKSVTATTVSVGSATPANAHNASTSWTKDTPAKFSVIGGDANINELSIGKGGGQVAGNTVVGKDVILYNGNSGYNTAIGNEVLKYFNSGNNNTAIGNQALMNFNGGGGNNNIALGSGAGNQLHSGHYNILIGAGIQAPTDGASYQLTLGNFIYGKDGDNLNNTKVGIGVNDPTTKLHIQTSSPTGFRLVDGGAAPQANYVLTTVDNQGNATWKPAQSATSNAGIWYKVDNPGKDTPSTANTHNSYLNAKVVIGGTTMAQPYGTYGGDASLTVIGGDASINGVTVGRGNGDVVSNIAVGFRALWRNSDSKGIENTAISVNALQSIGASTGSNYSGNVSVGYSSMREVSEGGENVAIGSHALAGTTGSFLTTGIESNTAVGFHALELVGNNNKKNTALGWEAGKNVKGSNNINIGAGIDTGTGNNKINIGNLIFAKDATGETTGNIYNGNVGIGTNDPLQKLHIAGNTYTEGHAWVGDRIGVKVPQGVRPRAAIHILSDSKYVNANKESDIEIETVRPEDKGEEKYGGKGSPTIAFLASRGVYEDTGAADFYGDSYRGNKDAQANDVVAHIGFRPLYQGSYYATSAATFLKVTYLGETKSRFSLDNFEQIHFDSKTKVTTPVGFEQSSDARLKTNIIPLKYGLPEIMKLKPVNYELKSNPGVEHVGFIAQDVKQVIPEIVGGKEGDLEKGETLSIAYSEFAPILAKAIQEQQAQIDAQQKLIEQLMARLKELEAAK